MGKCLVTILDAEINNPNLPDIRDFSYAGYNALKTIPWANVIDTTAPLPWQQGSNLDAATYVKAAPTDVAYTQVTGSGNVVSDFIEVYPGMELKTTLIGRSEQYPVVVCYDSNKEPVGPGAAYCIWNDAYTSEKTLTIPAGVAYIVICIPAIDTYMGSAWYIKGGRSEE